MKANPPNRPPASAAWLPGLALALLTFFTDDYIISGILPEVARGLDVSEAAAGQLVTVFSLTLAIATPVAAVVFARTPRRILFPAAMAVFVAANVAMAFTTSYGVAVALRIISATAAASSMPAIFAAAADLSPEDRRGRTMSVLAMAAAVATAVGVPVGVWIASGWSWHATFLAMAAMGLLSGLLIMITFPGVETQPPTPLKEQFAVLAQRRISLAIVGGAVAIAGSLTLVTYVAPYLSETLGRDDMRSIAFLIFGIAATVGTFLGGWQSDARGPDRTIATGMSLFSVLMVLFFVAWLVRPASLLWFIPLVIAWGMVTYWSAPAIQVRLHQVAGPYSAQALAVNSSAGALGVAGGAALGGVIMSVAPVGVLALAGAVLGVIGLVLLLAAFSGVPEPDGSGDEAEDSADEADRAGEAGTTVRDATKKG